LVNTGGDQITPEYYFRYAQSLKSVQRYEEADQVMNAFETANGNDLDYKILVLVFMGNVLCFLQIEKTVPVL